MISKRYCLTDWENSTTDKKIKKDIEKEWRIIVRKKSKIMDSEVVLVEDDCSCDYIDIYNEFEDEEEEDEYYEFWRN